MAQGFGGVCGLELHSRLGVGETLMIQQSMLLYMDATRNFDDSAITAAVNGCKVSYLDADLREGRPYPSDYPMHSLLS